MLPLWTALADGPDLAGPEAAFPSPFDELGPAPVARRAAELLQDELRAGAIPASILDAPGGGKMFGVLVAREPGGQPGFLRAFSGTIDGRFDWPGFVPAIFDPRARAPMESAGEQVVRRLTLRARAFAASPELAAARKAAAALTLRHDGERREMRAAHAAARGERREQRRRLEQQEAAASAGALHELAQQSRRDKAERRVLEARHAEEREIVDQQLARFTLRLAAHERLHRMVSRRLMKRIHDTYRLTNARGETRALRDLFAPAEPPGGAGDCAAPKLLAFAHAGGLRPLALAEFWWGAPPLGGGRVRGAFYPACREKCGPLLPFLLEGMEVSPPRRFVAPEASALELRIVHEDEWIVVIDKPCGLLSVPSRSGVPDDSVLARLGRFYREVFLAHRLDLDTSGLLVAARDAGTHATLQRQFLRRTVEKRYVAIVEGEVTGERGAIDLPIRVDVVDRPRQIVDPLHGRRAITEWTVIGRTRAPGGPPRTRIAFFPRTGRTHQIRVHASHPLGLDAPIVGDRLYGHDGERLLLHAEAIAFTHPATGERVSFESPAPF